MQKIKSGKCYLVRIYIKKGGKMMEQYEKDKEIERLNKDVSRLEELLSVSETQYASVEQIVERLQEQLKEANGLLLDFCSEDECQFDHNGYCQEHDSCEGGYKCIQKDLKQYLKKWGVK